MKIDFNENGMTINFDKVPKFLYFNENNEGCGQIFLNGVRTKMLQDVKVHAHTREINKSHPLKYSITYFDNEQHCSKTIGCNVNNDISICVKILDLEPLKKVVGLIEEIIKDDRIPEDIQQEYANKIVAAIKPDYAIYSGNEIYDFGMEDK